MTRPSDICDCHMHIFDSRFPVLKNAIVPAAAARVGDYLKFRKQLGPSRCVVVQPSGYGVDNRCTLDALGQMGESARGVAVIDTSASTAHLQDLHDRGIRGIRFNLVQAGATSVDMLEPLASRISAFHWHLQIHSKPDTLIQIHERLPKLPVPVVLDHIGLVGTTMKTAAPIEKLLFDLAKTGRVWIKLSGLYLNGWNAGEAAPELAAFVRELSRLAPDRLVWGSDWPHVTEAVAPDDALMMDTLRQWVDDPAIWQKILCLNPALLYDFPQSDPSRGVAP